MADLTKKVLKKAGHDLVEGEPVIATRVVQPKGQALRQALGGAAFTQLGGLHRTLIQGRLQNYDSNALQATAATGAMAASFPQKKCFFSVTDRRVLVHSFASMTGSPKDLLAAYRLTDFAGLDAESGALTGKLTLYMIDGSTVALDVLKGGGKPQELVDDFNAALARWDTA